MMTLYFNKLINAPLYLKIATWIMLASLFIAISFFSLVQPSQTRLTQAMQQQQSDKQQLQQKRQQQRATASIDQRTLQAYEHYRNALTALPRQLNLSALAKTLSQLATHNDLRLIRLLPQQNNKDDYYQFFDLQLHLEGLYHNIKSFIKSIDQLEYPLRMESILLRNTEHSDNPQSSLAITTNAVNPLGIQLRMRGYCCADTAEQEDGQAASTSPSISAKQSRQHSTATIQSIPSPQSDPFSWRQQQEPNLSPKQDSVSILIDKEHRQAKPKSMDTIINVMPINYARAQTIADLLQNLIANQPVSIAVDNRTNALILHSQKNYLPAIQNTILALDVPIRQVMIEAMIVIARRDFSKRLGINLQIGGDNAATSSRSQFIFNGGISANLQFGFINNHNKLQIALDAMENAGDGEIISRPRLITSNLRTASIKAGTQIPFQESAPNGRTTTQFKDAVLRLDVTPIIMPDNRITLDLLINQDAPGAAVSNGEGTLPSIDTTELRTQITLKENETAALGGVFRFDASNATSKTPVLGDLPFLGHLFRHTNNRMIKSETLFFITPRILDDE